MRTRRLLLDLGRELRVARITSGGRLRDIAHRTGLSASYLSQIELGRAGAIQLADLASISAAVGLRLTVRVYPLERRLLDAGQLALIARLKARLHASWRIELEVPMPIPGDLRALDARLDGPVTIAVEAWTRLADVQAQVRAATLKRRDVAADRLLLVVAATTSNRHAVRVARDILAAAFPVPSRAALRALRDGLDPGGDAIALL